MDDSDGGDAGARSRRSDRHPKVKYLKSLQDVADRVTSQVLIELDDLDSVRIYMGTGLRESG